MGIVCRELTFDAGSGEGKIFARYFIPAEGKAVCGILQIAHGMAEHSLRYREFAEYLAERGFVVCMNDHAGHGKSVAEGGTFGYFGPNGYLDSVKDMDKLRRIMQKQFPQVPYLIMGHSMGSFLTRRYLTEYGEGVRGAVICGTSAGYPGPVMALGLAFANRVVKKKGPKGYDNRLKQLTIGGYNRSFRPARTEYDWLSREKGQVDLYCQDPLCGFDFTVSGYRELVKMLKEVNQSKWFRQVPDIPILLLSGDRDPVGSFGKGVKKVYRRLLKTGHRVQLALYPGGRHEMLNETNKGEVYETISGFLSKALENSSN